MDVEQLLRMVASYGDNVKYICPRVVLHPDGSGHILAFQLVGLHDSVKLVEFDSLADFTEQWENG